MIQSFFYSKTQGKLSDDDQRSVYACIFQVDSQQIGSCINVAHIQFM